MLLDQFLQAREFFGREMFGFDEAHHQTLSRTAKQTIDDVGHVLTDYLFPRVSLSPSTKSNYDNSASPNAN
jgi:hypothetical protein